MPWHMMQWGNNHSACFAAEEGDRFFLDRLTELSQQFGCAVHAYTLMTHMCTCCSRRSAQTVHR